MNPDRVTVLLLWLAFLGAGLATPAIGVAQAKTVVQCRVAENGKDATGQVRIISDANGAEVASGRCGERISVAAGRYRMVVRLDGALDKPEVQRLVELKSGGPAIVDFQFETGRLAVKVSKAGKKAAALATIYRNGKRVGTLAGGVSGRLSTGSYEVEVRYHGEKRRFDAVVVRPGQERIVSIEF